MLVREMRCVEVHSPSGRMAQVPPRSLSRIGAKTLPLSNAASHQSMAPLDPD